MDDGTLVSRAELEIANADEYLGGVCDLTGEIGRFAVQRATKRDEAAVRNCLSLVDAIQGEVRCSPRRRASGRASAGSLTQLPRAPVPQLLQFDFRNGSLRKKYDSVKYTVRKLETILYEMSLMRRSEAADVKEESGGEGPGSGAAAGDEA